MKQKVLEILNELDPQGLLKMGAPSDEYTIEATSIASLIKQDMSKQDILDLVYGVFKEMFGDELAGERSSYQRIADRVYMVSRGGGM